MYSCFKDNLTERIPNSRSIRIKLSLRTKYHYHNHAEQIIIIVSIIININNAIVIILLLASSSSAAAASKRFGTLKAPPTMHGELARLEAQLARLLSIKNRHT